VSKKIQPTDFADVQLAAAWGCIVQLSAKESHDCVDVVRLAESGGAKMPGMFAKLTGCLDDTMATVNFAHHCEQFLSDLKEQAARDGLGRALAAATSEPDHELAINFEREAIDEAGRVFICDGQSMAEIAKAAHEGKDEAVVRHSVGIPGLDHWLGGGVSRGGLHIFGGATGAGKTALALQAVDAFCRRDKRKVFIFSCEMLGRELYGRMSARLICNGRDPTAIQHYNIDVRNSPLIIDKIENEVRATPDAGLVVVDYLQRVRATRVNRTSNREREVAEISERLKTLALTCRVPVIACAQLNRQSSAENRAPALTDLRESGAIEQDADTVTVIDRRRSGEDGWDDDGWLRVIKNRAGKTGGTPVVFDGKAGEFRELTKF
jgi:replicative DNA helicase